MKSNNYVVIQGWMCNELELKNTELLIYALIYGFCQDNESRFRGSRTYIAETFNISLPTVDKALNQLIKKDYIEKFSVVDDKGNHNEYIVKRGSKETLPGGSKETLHNNTNTSINNTDNTITSKQADKGFLGSAKKEKKQSLYDKCSAMIHDFVLREYVMCLGIDELTYKLHKYLNMLLEMKKESGETFYSNNFKGKLNELKKFPISDWIDIVNQSLENGWKSFYALKNKSISSGADDEDNRKKREAFLKEKEKNGERTIF